jgi:uncharacterized membrane protein YeaQ/YmgE (transglycosylase-associated protein family)
MPILALMSRQVAGQPPSCGASDETAAQLFTMSTPQSGSGPTTASGRARNGAAICPSAWAPLGRHFQEQAMNFIAWLIVGGLIGWIASKIMNTDAQQGIVLNIVVGIVGAFLGGYLIAPMLGTGTINQNDFSVMGLVTSLIGAVILLAIANLVLRGRAR